MWCGQWRGSCRRRSAVVAEVEAIAAFEPTVRDYHTAGLVVGEFDVGSDGPGLVGHRRRGGVGKANGAGIVRHRSAPGGQGWDYPWFGFMRMTPRQSIGRTLNFAASTHQRSCSSLSFSRVLFGEVVCLREVIVDFVELPSGLVGIARRGFGFHGTKEATRPSILHGRGRG